MHVLAAKHDIVAVGRRAVGSKLGPQLEPVCCFVVVVGHEVRAEINVPVGRGGSPNDHGADNSVAVLVGIVAVVPGRAVLLDVEVVNLHAPWGDGTLGDTIGAVLIALAVLADAMPVDGSSIVLHVIIDVDLDVVTPVDLERWSGELS